MIRHPVFGRVPRVVTLKSLGAGTELSCHYMIDMAEAANLREHCQWYLDLWDEFSSKGNKRFSEYMDIEEDDAYSMSTTTE